MTCRKRALPPSKLARDCRICTALGRWIRSLLLLTYIAIPLGATAGEWQQGDGFRRARLNVPTEGKTGFQKLEAEPLGITITNHISQTRSILNRNLLNGSGVAAGDVDGDGLCDLYFCGLDSDNVLYRNLGDWKFEDITRSAGVACAKQDSTGAVLADVDGDGDLDLLVTALGRGARLFQNDGKAHFREITEQAGLASKAGSMSMALADVDGDGDLDLYVANYRVDTIADQPTTTYRVEMVKGRPVVALVNGQPVTSAKWTNRFEVAPSGEVLELGEPDAFYLNDGSGKFQAVSFTGGFFLDEAGAPLVKAPGQWGLTVQMHDFTGDGAPDIYVCNDFFTPDGIWVNDGKGRFRAIAATAIRTTSVFSMGVDLADIDRDGHVDIFVVDMLSPDHQKRHIQLGGRSPFHWPVGLVDNRPQISRNTLQRNRGDGTFAEIGFFGGVEASDWSWSPVFLDVDLDGFEDILVVNGVLRDFQNIDMANRIERERAGKRLTQSQILQFMSHFPTLETPNLVYRNKGNWTFQEVGAAWGFATPSVSQSMALADLDEDGDLDVIVNNLRSAPGIYRNDGTAPRLAVRLKGDQFNREGIGAKVTVRGGPVDQSQEIICGGRYLSGSQAMRVFAAGAATNSLTIEVVWRSGKRRLIHDASPNCLYEINEAGAAVAQGDAARPSPQPQPIFEDVSALLKHRHVEQPFDDFARQPLLPHRLSQSGPGVCWHDIDGDGWDDLIIGTGRSGHIAVYRNDGQGGFAAVLDPPVTAPAMRDQTTVLGLSLNTILAGSSNYEDGQTNGGAIRIFDLARKASGESILGQSSSTGPLASADIDGDGDLDLFVGGRSVPGRYPEPATSLLMSNNAGRFVVAQRWEKLGLVSGAVFSDLDDDGLPELILACDWGPIRVFQNNRGSFSEITAKLGLADYKGWWNGVTAGDINGDGRMDLIASNWGLNSRYRTSKEHPRRIYFRDFNGNGTVDLIEAYYNPDMKKIAPDRWFTAVAAAMPFLQEKVPSYEMYAGSSVEEIYGEALQSAGVLEASTLASMVFFNRGDHFEGVELPSEAQLAPAFGVCVGDMDGDGAEDVFLSHNFFATNSDNSRCDAGRGLWLRGDGKGGLVPVAGQHSGVKVYGEQRGCALADYDRDGRVDLVVAQNGHETKLYRNVRGRPGLRVRLDGGPSNPYAIGAAICLESDQRKGPTREIHGGSGYWSQDSAVVVLNLPDTPSRVLVRWPGGKKTISAIPADVHEVSIAPDGKLTRVR